MMLKDLVGGMMLMAIASLAFATAFMLVALGISFLRDSRRDGK